MKSSDFIAGSEAAWWQYSASPQNGPYAATTHGGPKVPPRQYRPVTLTSCVIKAFGRVIKKHTSKQMINNNYTNGSQHGFVPDKTTQNINETLMQATRRDTLVWPGLRDFRRKIKFLS